MARVLTIAGSDSGGGAGIQADLKTIAALGCFGSSAITAVTAQNTESVVEIESLSPQIVGQQIRAVLDDIGTDAIKIGMVSACEAIAESIADAGVPIVFDPLVAAKVGRRLVPEEEVKLFIRHLFPLADLITPNVAEAHLFVGAPLDIEEAGRRLLKMGPKAALITGDSKGDCLVTAQGVEWFAAEPLSTRNTHGTGCTLSSAIASYLARGFSMIDAVRGGERFVKGCMERFSGLTFGRGAGPIQPILFTEEERPAVRG